MAKATGVLDELGISYEMNISFPLIAGRMSSLNMQNPLKEEGLRLLLPAQAWRPICRRNVCSAPFFPLVIGSDCIPRRLGGRDRTFHRSDASGIPCCDSGDQRRVNAALLAAKILAVSDEGLLGIKLKTYSEN